MKSQTLNLLKKEIKLGNSVQSICWTICCFGMYLIPSYPYYVGPFYITLAIMMTFALNQSSHDILYTVLLPVRKIDTVKARFLYCGMYEILALVLALVGALVHKLLPYPDNSAGINITVAYFGLQLIVFSVFNLIFLGNVYKNPLKPGVRFMVASAAYLILFFIFEFPVWNYWGMISGLKKGGYDLSWAINDALIRRPWYSLENIGHYLTSTDMESQFQQLPVFAVGLVIFALSWLLTFRRAARLFEKYDL